MKGEGNKGCQINQDSLPRGPFFYFFTLKAHKHICPFLPWFFIFLPLPGLTPSYFSPEWTKAEMVPGFYSVTLVVLNWLKRWCIMRGGKKTRGNRGPHCLRQQKPAAICCWHFSLLLFSAPLKLWQLPVFSCIQFFFSLPMKPVLAAKFLSITRFHSLLPHSRGWVQMDVSACPCWCVQHVPSGAASSGEEAELWCRSI